MMRGEGLLAGILDHIGTSSTDIPFRTTSGRECFYSSITAEMIMAGGAIMSGEIERYITRLDNTHYFPSTIASEHSCTVSEYIYASLVAHRLRCL
jgi:hypothetical protein